MTTLHWKEIVQAPCVTDRFIERTAKGIWNKNGPRFGRHNHKRLIINRATKALLDPIQNIDAREYWLSIRQEATERNFELSGIFQSIWKLHAEGWYISSEKKYELKRSQGFFDLDLTPDIVVARGVERCYLYFYYRSYPRITSDAARAMKYLLLTGGPKGENYLPDVMLFNCSNDSVYNLMKFDHEEPVVQDRIKRAIDIFNDFSVLLH